ncbi:MAG: molybdate ABC transporter permease subunit [Rubricoccaceae bacterium]
MTVAEWEAIALSLRAASLATALAMAPGIALGYAFARRTGPMWFAVEQVTLLPLVLPPVVTGYALLLLLPQTVAFTWWAGVLASSIVGFPLLVQASKAAFLGIDPLLEDAARTDGAGAWARFRQVVLPLASRGIGAGAVLHFGRALGEFGATIVVAGNLPGTTQTLPLLLYTRLQQPGGGLSALRLAGLAVIVSIVCLGAYAVLMRRAHRSE